MAISGLTDAQQAALLSLDMSVRPAAFARMTGQNGAACPVVCEECGAVVPLRDSHSLYVEHRVSDGLAPIRCNQAQGGFGQHFGCSIEHAYAAAHRCLEEHIKPAHLTALAERDARRANVLPTPEERDANRFPARDDTLPTPPVTHKF